MYARSFGDVFSPAALMFEHLSHLCIRTASTFRLKDHANSCDASSRLAPIRKEWVHGHSEGVYLVPFRTQKSSPSASLPLLWYESPRERKSLCPSPSLFQYQDDSTCQSIQQIFLVQTKLEFTLL